MSTKLLGAFKNLLSDALPRPPRNVNPAASNDVPDDNVQECQSENESSSQAETGTKDKNFKKKNPSKSEFFESTEEHDPGNNSTPKSESNVNTQATGNVVNIIGSTNVHWGNKFVYYMGKQSQGKSEDSKEDSDEECVIEKDNLITLLMESTDTPEHEYIDYISKNLGKNWHRFFRKLGFTKGRIETVEIDEMRNGVSEARYQLLLDWSRNADNVSLGRLVTLLWKEGERLLVKELSIIYSKNK